MKKVRSFAMAVLALALPVGLMALVAPASAYPTGTHSTVLCKTFSSCAAKGYSSDGYAAVYKQSFWGQVAGHNCSNFVAYSLSHNGRSVARPVGMSSTGKWGDVAKAAGVRVDNAPVPGAVAWWRGGYHGASSNGHVAMVHEVRADGSIVIKEDNLKGEFQYRSMSRNHSKSWPSGFIHFPQSDGSPEGKISSVKVSPRTVSIAGWVHDPDFDVKGKTAHLSYVWGDTSKMSLAQIRESNQSEFRIGPLPVSWTTTLTTSRVGHQTLTVYAENRGAGESLLLGTYDLVLPSPTFTSARAEKSTIKRSTRPVLTVMVRNAGTGVVPVGTVTVKEGSKTRAKVSMVGSKNGVVKVTLPKASKGTRSYVAHFSGKNLISSKSSTVKVKVK